MHVLYTSTKSSSSDKNVTLESSGEVVCMFAATLEPVLAPVLVGVQGSKADGKGEVTCWARFVLQMRFDTMKQERPTRTVQHLHMLLQVQRPGKQGHCQTEHTKYKLRNLSLNNENT